MNEPDMLARGRVTRRRALLAGLGALGLPNKRAGAASAPHGWVSQLLPLPDGAALRQLHAGGPSGLLGITADGALWALSPAGLAARRLADGLDAGTPPATGHGRIAARTAEGGLWILDDATRAGAADTLRDAALAPHAGLLVLPFAVLGIVTDAAAGGHPVQHRLARFEPAGGKRWAPVARSHDALLPDTRPQQADLDGRGDGGHIVVLAGPDAQRYRHGVLGDTLEATRVLWLERHGLEVLRSLSLPAPHVFEDIAPRLVALAGRQGATGLLTVRSGPDGGRLALVTADPTRADALQLGALGEPVGGFHRWLAPTTDGRQMAAVHTPHIGGELHVYRQEGPRLIGRRLATGVSTHTIGSRETDLAVWLQGRLLLPTQDGRTLRALDSSQGWAEQGALPLPGRVVQATALREPGAGAGTWAGLLDDGRVLLARAGPA